jgi:Cysteine rich repeat
MAQQDASGRIFAVIFTALGLGLVWLTVVFSLPSEQEFSAREPRVTPRTTVASEAQTMSEPTLDLSIPGVPSGGPVPPDQNQPDNTTGVSSAVSQHDPREAQIAHLRCEAEIGQLCPDLPEGPARKQCLEKQERKLSTPCQRQLRERFVKWKEERRRLVTACQADVKRWCASIKPGEGQILQCLQDHVQDLSDRCYETLPKGTVYFTQ